MTADFYDVAQYGNYSQGELNCDTSMLEPSAVPEVVGWIQLTVHPILLLQGTVGNILAIPALVSISRSSWSTIMYLAFLGVTDLIILLIRCGDSWYREMTGESLSKQVMDSSDAVCRTYLFVFTFVKHVNPWLMVALSVEMMIATRWPRKTYVMCTLERARYALMLITIILICLNIHLYWTHGVRKTATGCLYNEEFSEDFRDSIWPALDNMVEHLLPLLVVSFCFFLTATTMIRRPASQEKDVELEMKKYFIELTTLRDFRTIALIMCLIFMCLATTKVTFSILDLLTLRTTYLQFDCVTGLKFQNVMDLLKTLDFTATYIFYGIKIYFYLAFSAAFRARLRLGFVCLAQKVRIFSKSVFHCGHRWMPISLQENQGVVNNRRLNQDKALLLRASHGNHGQTLPLTSEEPSNTNVSLSPEISGPNMSEGGRGESDLQRTDDRSLGQGDRSLGQGDSSLGQGDGSLGQCEGDHIPMQEVGTKV